MKENNPLADHMFYVSVMTTGTVSVALYVGVTIASWAVVTYGASVGICSALVGIFCAAITYAAGKFFSKRGADRVIKDLCAF